MQSTVHWRETENFLLLSTFWQDYNFNQKTSSTWPKFSICYSPYAVFPHSFPKISFWFIHSLSFMLFPVATPWENWDLKKIIAKIVNEEATGNSFRSLGPPLNRPLKWSNFQGKKILKKYQIMTSETWVFCSIMDAKKLSPQRSWRGAGKRDPVLWDRRKFLPVR